jgi:hypothetical protein
VNLLVLTHREFIEACAIAGVMLLAIFWQLRRLDWRDAEGEGGRVWRGESLLSFVLLALSAAFLGATIEQGVRQDYFLYRGIWGVVREGHDPWWLTLGFWGNYPTNAYGPLFNGLAIFDWFNPILPKLLFAWTYLLFAVGTIKATRRAMSRGLLTAVGGIIWFWNPYAWIEIARYGHFDVLIGMACVAAVAARTVRRDVPSGASLALGVLLKYIPGVLLPFLILDRGRFRLRLLGVAVAGILIGFGVSVLLWGPATFRPIRFAVGRQSEYLSVYRFLEGTYSPIHGLDIRRDLHYLVTPLLLLALLRAWNWCRRRCTEPASAAVLAILITLLLYQVGFPQYQMVLFVLASYWIVRKWEALMRRQLPLVALGGYFAWIATFDIIEATKGVDYLAMRDWAGLVTFVLGCLLIAGIVRSSPIEDAECPVGGPAS